MYSNNIQPVNNSFNRASDNMYANPEYIRLMMMQQINPANIFSTGNDNVNPLGTGIGGSSGDFMSQLIKAGSPAITPQMELSIYGGLIGKKVSATHNDRNYEGNVNSVHLKGKEVVINIDGNSFYAKDIVISRIQ